MPEPPAFLTPLAAVHSHLGLTQVALATYLGVSRVQLAHLQSGRRDLNPAG